MFDLDAGSSKVDETKERKNPYHTFSRSPFSRCSTLATALKRPFYTMTCATAAAAAAGFEFLANGIVCRMVDFVAFQMQPSVPVAAHVLLLLESNRSLYRWSAKRYHPRYRNFKAMSFFRKTQTVRVRFLGLCHLFRVYPVRLLLVVLLLVVGTIGYR